MAKKEKKYARVGPQLRREWLRRFDEDEESLPSIAKKEGYDPRTVRKNIDLARQEREMREARTLVFRNAIEEHYGDLIRFAERLDAELARSSSLVSTAKGERMWGALRQHVPRSPIWKTMDKLSNANIMIGDTLKKLDTRLEEELIESKVFVDFAHRWENMGMVSIGKGLNEAIVHALHQPESLLWELFEAGRITNGTSQVRYGPFNCGTMPDESVEEFKKLFTGLVSSAGQWPEVASLRGVLAERNKLVDAIREDLATIILRRVVPGKCKYCPM